MHVTCSTNQRQLQVDLKIKNTLLRLRKEVRINTMVVARQQTLKELVAPNMENQPLCINIDNNVNFELKYGFIHLLPIFNGLVGEDPHTHLKEFHMVCDAIQPSKDLLELPVGPFTRLGAKKFKEAFNRLLQDTWAKVDFKRIGNNKEQALINLIHVQEGFVGGTKTITEGLGQED